MVNESDKETIYKFVKKNLSEGLRCLVFQKRRTKGCAFWKSDGSKMKRLNFRDALFRLLMTSYI